MALRAPSHEMRGVFDRHHIVSPADLQDVARKLTGAVTGTASGTGAPR